MKLTLTTLVMILFVSLLAAAPSWSEGTSLDDLVVRDDLFHKKFTDVPFTGEIDEGLERGSFKNGEREGPWVSYWDNGQLSSKFDYKNGKLEGPWIYYYEDGQLDRKGDYKNDKQEGPWVSYHDNGQLWWKGDHKNGEQEGPYVCYHDNGQLHYEGNYKNGKQEGPWVWYSDDGTVNNAFTGTDKNGEKISD